MESNVLRGRFLLIAIITGLLVWSFLGSEVRLGQDLKGGTTLRFSLDIDGAIEAGRLEEGIDRQKLVSDTVRVIEDRINRSGLAEANLTTIGEDKFEISLPAGTAQVDQIVRVVSSLGDLLFAIEVLPDERYSDAQEYTDVRKRSRVYSGSTADFDAFKKEEFALWQKLKSQGKEYKPSDPRYRLVLRDGTAGTTADDFAVIEVMQDKNLRFDGGILSNPRTGRDNYGKLVVLFDIKTEWQNAFGEWTGTNTGLPMAIILNERFKTAPYIRSRLSDSVQVELGRGQDVQKEAEALATTLQTGSLKIQPNLESKNRVGASLAGQARDRGILAIIVAFCLVLVFMVVYYRAAGLVANFALLLNLVLLVGFLAFFQAVLTLPGIAGIILTVGMAVDANILITERIREERRLGRSVSRAMAEGYDRAMSAIIDANVTSIITAIFLYTYGSGSIRGFAITLAIGLLVSMFTAIYVTRTIFEWRLKNGGMQKLGSYGSKQLPKIGWIAMRRYFAPLSVAGVIFGLVTFFMADPYTMYDVDFTGGFKVRTRFHERVDVDQVKQRMAKEERTVEVTSEQWEGQERVTRTQQVKVGPFPDAQVLEILDEGSFGVEMKVQRLFDKPHEGVREQEVAQAFENYIADVFNDKLVPSWMLEQPTRYTHDADATSDPALADLDGGLKFKVAFQDPENALTGEDLQKLLETRMPYIVTRGDEREVYRELTDVPGGLVRTVRVVEQDAKLKGSHIYEIWMKSEAGGNPSAENSEQQLRDSLAEYLGSSSFNTDLQSEIDQRGAEGRAGVSLVSLSDPFPSTDVIGKSVANRMKNDALLALVLSLIGIIIYIGIRFRSRAMGFAAVVCLFHDVAITLGLVAVANSLGLVDAKLNLAMVAAFLTLVGYSVNDTVVIFDRIRENRGNRKTDTPQIINLAINQTLARTIRTSLTFLLVCLALFGFNIGQRNVLEGFAFLLILGSVIGTYSTIAISSPLVLYLPWLWKRIGHLAPKSEIMSKTVSNGATILLTPIVAVLWLAWGLVFAVIAFLVGLALFVPWAMTTKIEGDDVSGGPDDPAATTAAVATA